MSKDGQQREQFGNLVLSRLPVHSVFHHPLPQPADGHIKQMPRQLIEVTVKTRLGLLRIMTTHLEFHSAEQRFAQSGRIMDIQAEMLALEKDPPLAVENTPYSQLTRPSSCIVCGDFNFLTDSPEYELLTSERLGSTSFVDA